MKSSPLSVGRFIQNNLSVFGFSSSGPALLQMIKELFDNACDAVLGLNVDSSDHYITISLKKSEKDEFLCVTVEDSGSGIQNTSSFLDPCCSDKNNADHSGSMNSSMGRFGVGLNACLFYSCSELSQGSTLRIVTRAIRNSVDSTPVLDDVYLLADYTFNTASEEIVLVQKQEVPAELTETMRLSKCGTSVSLKFPLPSEDVLHAVIDQVENYIRLLASTPCIVPIKLSLVCEINLPGERQCFREHISRALSRSQWEFTTMNDRISKVSESISGRYQQKYEGYSNTCINYGLGHASTELCSLAVTIHVVLTQRQCPSIHVDSDSSTISCLNMLLSVNGIPISSDMSNFDRIPLENNPSCDFYHSLRKSDSWSYFGLDAKALEARAAAAADDDSIVQLQQEEGGYMLTALANLSYNPVDEHGNKLCIWKNLNKTCICEGKSGQLRGRRGGTGSVMRIVSGKAIKAALLDLKSKLNASNDQKLSKLLLTTIERRQNLLTQKLIPCVSQYVAKLISLCPPKTKNKVTKYLGSDACDENSGSSDCTCSSTAPPSSFETFSHAEDGVEKYPKLAMETMEGFSAVQITTNDIGELVPGNLEEDCAIKPPRQHLVSRIQSLLQQQSCEFIS